MQFAIRLMLQSRVYIRTPLEMHNIFATKQAFYGEKKRFEVTNNSALKLTVILYPDNAVCTRYVFFLSCLFGHLLIQN